jgi:pyrroline-5-carboxylate reductase
MTKLYVGCIGTGNMGGALMRAVAGVTDPSAIGLSSLHGESARTLAAALGATACDNARIAAEADYIFLGVKPQGLPDLLAELAPALSERAAAGTAPVLISMAAGVKLAQLQGMLAKDDRIPPFQGGGALAPGVVASGNNIPLIRIMPNTPVQIGEGVIALAALDASRAQIDEVKRLLSKAGLVDEIDESLFDAVTALSGSGPAFAYQFIIDLVGAACAQGMPKAQAQRYAAQTVLGAARMVQVDGRSPQELLDAVCSPHGTTIAGLEAMRAAGFADATAAAVDAAAARSREMSA